MADTAFSEKKSSKVGQVLISYTKELGGLWPFSNVEMLFGVWCVPVAYEEIVAAELLPLLLLSISQPAQSCAHACRDANLKHLFKNKKIKLPCV